MFRNDSVWWFNGETEGFINTQYQPNTPEPYIASCLC